MTKKNSNILKGKKAKLPPPDKLELTEWDWTTLVAAWRYYENGSTIASATFPADIMHRFFSKGSQYSDEARRTIAHQFAKTDHGMRGEGDWEWRKQYPIHDIDRAPWCKFYRFCEGYVDGFPTVRFKHEGLRDAVETEAFHVDATGRWYPVNEYINAPMLETWIPDEWIVEVIQPSKENSNDN